MSRNNTFHKISKWKNVMSVVLVIHLMFGMTFSNDMISYAAPTDTTENTEASSENSTKTNQSEVDKARDDALEASRNKQKAQAILDKLNNAKDNLESYVIEVDKSLNALTIEISHLEENKKELEESIKETEDNLKIAEEAQEEQYEEMKQRIQMVYESGNKQYMDVLLTATSMTEVLNRTEYIYQVSLYDYNILKEFKSAREQVANLKMKLEKDMETNENLQKEVNDQKKNLEVVLEEKNKQISEYEVSIEGQEEEVAKYMKAQAQAEAIIAAAERASSSSGPYTGGKFTWPVPSSTWITSYYGEREQPVKGASVFHKGIDIACNYGCDIVSATAGTVVSSGYDGVMGNFVMIDHGGGVFTVYMHNQSLLVSNGQAVTAGQVIAKGGTSGVSTGPHCHFGVRVNGSYVDPLTYLR